MTDAEAESSIAPSDDAPAGGLKITRVIKATAIIGILLIVVLLAAALAAALTAAERWAPFVQIFRDVFLLLVLLESVLLIAALAIMLLQIAGFFIMLRSEVKPILDNARETTRLSKATAQFVNSNAVDPLIQIKTFMAGLLAFLRELIRLRGLVEAENQDRAEDKQDETETD